MSLNLSIAASHASHLAAFSADGPGCGTHPPGWHPTWPPQPHVAMSLHAPLSGALPDAHAQAASTSARMDVDDIPLCPPPPPRPWQEFVGPASLSVLNALGVSGGASPAQAGQDRGIIIIGG